MRDRRAERQDALLDAARRGDPAAWRQLFDELAPKVAGYLRVQGATEVDDLTSEVFLGVFRGIGSFEGDVDRFRSWVFVIAHRRLTDERRRRARSRQDLVVDVPEVDVAPDAGDAALTRMGDARALALCERLVPDQRDVLLLRIAADLTVAQVAEVLGKSEGAVKQLQRRGLASLQRLLSTEAVPL